MATLQPYFAAGTQTGSTENIEVKIALSWPTLGSGSFTSFGDFAGTFQGHISSIFYTGSINLAISLTDQNPGSASGPAAVTFNGVSDPNASYQVSGGQLILQATLQGNSQTIAIYPGDGGTYLDLSGAVSHTIWLKPTGMRRAAPASSRIQRPEPQAVRAPRRAARRPEPRSAARKARQRERSAAVGDGTPVSNSTTATYSCALDQDTGDCVISGSTSSPVGRWDMVCIYEDSLPSDPEDYDDYFYVSEQSSLKTDLPFGSGYYVAYVSYNYALEQYVYVVTAGPT